MRTLSGEMGMHLAWLKEQPTWATDCIQWRRKVLGGDFAHYCQDWDQLPVDETCKEFESCSCFPRASETSMQ